MAGEGSDETGEVGGEGTSEGSDELIWRDGTSGGDDLDLPWSMRKKLFLSSTPPAVLGRRLSLSASIDVCDPIRGLRVDGGLDALANEDRLFETE